MAEVTDQAQIQRSADGATPRLYHVPVCPFSQRLEILLTLKCLRHLVDFRVVDITRPRPGWLLEKTSGTTALPVLETESGGIIKESMVLLRYFEDLFPEPAVAQRTGTPPQTRNWASSDRLRENATVSKRPGRRFMRSRSARYHDANDPPTRGGEGPWIS